MLSYLTIGATDIARSAAFYDAILVPLGYEKHIGDDYAQYSLPGVVDRDNGPGTIYVMKPFDGEVATVGNGMMPAFRASDATTVMALHAVGIAAGGVDQGAPGKQARYTDTFFVSHLRDPVGNKVALFTVLGH